MSSAGRRFVASCMLTALCIFGHARPARATDVQTFALLNVRLGMTSAEARAALAARGYHEVAQRETDAMGFHVTHIRCYAELREVAKRFADTGSCVRLITSAGGLRAPRSFTVKFVEAPDRHGVSVVFEMKTMNELGPSGNSLERAFKKAAFSRFGVPTQSVKTTDFGMTNAEPGDFLWCSTAPCRPEGQPTPDRPYLELLVDVGGEGVEQFLLSDPVLEERARADYERTRG